MATLSHTYMPQLNRIFTEEPLLSQLVQLLEPPVPNHGRRGLLLVCEF